MAFETSCRSNLLTMSKVFSGIDRLPCLIDYAVHRKDAHNKLYGVKLFVKRKEAIKILRRLHADIVGRKPASSPPLPRYFFHEHWLVALAAVRYWREKWRIGFDQHSVERGLFSGFTNLLRFGKSDVAGEGNHESHLQCLSCIDRKSTR